MINQFKGEHRWLSNFHSQPVMWNGIWFPTNEHAYQAAKSENAWHWDHILSLAKPYDAMHAGRHPDVVLRPDWDDAKLYVMLDLNFQKFQFDPLRQKLMDTGFQELAEGNTWNDTFWGINLETGKGHNHLGRILMTVREHLYRTEQTGCGPC